MSISYPNIYVITQYIDKPNINLFFIVSIVSFLFLSIIKFCKDIFNSSFTSYNVYDLSTISISPVLLLIDKTS